MKKILTISAVIIATVCMINNFSFADDSIMVKNKQFDLKWSQKNARGYINEYPESGKGVDNWREMITISTIEGQGDYKGYVDALAKAVSKMPGEGKILVDHKPDYSIVMFCLDAPVPSENVECNYLKAQKKDNSLYLYQYAVRYFSSEMRKKEINKMIAKTHLNYIDAVRTAPYVPIVKKELKTKSSYVYGFKDKKSGTAENNKK